MKDFLILFGLPGSGKSFVSKILQKHFGYTLHDGDDEITIDMKKALFEKKVVTDEMRKSFYDAMLKKLDKLQKENNKLVFMQTLLKDDLRQKIHQKYPGAKFLLVDSKDETREKRYLQRKSFNLGLKYLRQTSDLFEKPTIPYLVIENNTVGEKNILLQLGKKL